MENKPVHTEETLKFLEDLRNIGFTPEEEQKLRDSLTWLTYKKGDIIDSQNEIMQRRLYVINGAARSYYIKDGKEYNYSFHFDGQFMIPSYTLLKRGVPVFFQFLKKTEVCYMPVSPKNKNKFPSLDTAKFQQFLNVGLVHLISEMEENLFMLRMDAKDRYNWIVKRYPRILDVISISQLASYLDVTKETIYRIRSGKY